MDFSVAYKVEGYGGIAWRIDSYATETVEEWEEWVYDGEDGPDDDVSYTYNEFYVENTSRVRCHMVGDDRIFEFDVDELTPISEDDYCPECGQIGCHAIR